MTSASNMCGGSPPAEIRSPRRSPRAAPVFAVLASALWVSVVTGGGASAAFTDLAIADRNCAAAAPVGGLIDLSTAFDGAITVKASADGQTGVFFVGWRGETYVVKFEASDNQGVSVSRDVMREFAVPHDALTGQSRDPAVIRATFDKIAAAAPPAAAATDFDRRLRALRERFDLPALQPRTVIVTKFLTAFNGMPHLSAGLRMDPRYQHLNQAAQLTAIRHFAGAVDGLSKPHNQGLLGYLYIIDAFLGNQDRMMQARPNLGNVFVAAGAAGTPCFVAIDNEGFAPSQAYLAMLESLPPGVVPNPDPNNPTVIEVKRRITLRAADYYDLLMGPYLDRTSTRAWTGPAAAFTGVYGPDAGDVAKTIAPCGPPDAGHDRHVSRIARFHRWMLVDALNRSFETLNRKTRNAPLPILTAASFVNHAVNGLELYDVRGTVAFSDETCRSEIKLTYADPAGNNALDVAIDWSAFDNNFTAGARQAMVDLQNVGDLDRRLTTIFGTAAPPEYTDMSKAALMARAYFIRFYMRSGLPNASTRPAIDVNAIKEDVLDPAINVLTGDVKIRGAMFYGTPDGIWLPILP
jgi:hypothetical protein